MKPGTKLPLHTDPTNFMVTYWMPLIVPPGCGLEVAGRDMGLTEGRAFGFNNSYEHRAWNDGDQTRVVLSVYQVHPGLTAVERHALTRLATALIPKDGAMPEKEIP